MTSVNNGRVLVAISGLALLVLLSRCSPINPSVDKRLIKNSTPTGSQSGMSVLKVRDTSGKDTSASLPELPSELKMIELNGEKLQEFKTEGRTKLTLEDLLPEQGVRFAQAYLMVGDRASDLESFEITVTALDRDNWVISVQAGVERPLSERVRANLTAMKLAFVVSADDSDPGAGSGSTHARGPGKKSP